MVQIDPVGRKPGRERQEATEGDEVEEGEAPSARLVSRQQQRAPDGVAREQFLAVALRDGARFVGRRVAGAELEIVGVAREPAINAGADQQEGEPRKVGSSKPESSDGEGQDQREQPGREIADAAIDAERRALPVAREPVRDLRDADRK